MNESNPEYSLIESIRGVESIQNCWQQCLQPAIQKFAGIIYNNPPTSGEVRDYSLMDLYARMHEEYTARSHTYTKDMLKIFNKLMKAYYS